LWVVYKGRIILLTCFHKWLLLLEIYFIVYNEVRYIFHCHLQRGMKPLFRKFSSYLFPFLPPRSVVGKASCRSISFPLRQSHNWKIWGIFDLECVNYQNCKCLWRVTYGSISFCVFTYYCKNMFLSWEIFPYLWSTFYILQCIQHIT
jgi:hypothetical protein